MLFFFSLDNLEFHWTPTATWYRWLKYLHEQQLLLDYINQSSSENQPTNQKEGVNQKKAETATNKSDVGTQKAESKSQRGKLASEATSKTKPKLTS